MNKVEAEELSVTNQVPLGNEVTSSFSIGAEYVPLVNMRTDSPPSATSDLPKESTLEVIQTKQRKDFDEKGEGLTIFKGNFLESGEPWT